MAKRKKKKATKKKAAGRGRKKAAKSKESLVVASKVKAYVRSKGYIASGDLILGLNDAVYRLLDSATERTDANRRSTVRPQDI